MTNPRVSILMACYNGAKFIPRSFESVIAQTWPNVELIFIDDGSTDDSREVASKYLDKFTTKGFELKVISQHNQGFCAAAANAATMASGKYLQILDVDDFIMPDSCRMQAEFLEKHPECNVVRTNGYIVQDDNPNVSQQLERNIPSDQPQNIFKELISGSINNWAGAYMVRAEKYADFYRTHTFPLSRFGQNLQFLLPLVIDSPAGFINVPLFKYFRYVGSHSNQINYDKQMENLRGYWDIRLNMLDLLEVNDASIRNLCETSFLKRAIAIAYEFKQETEYRKFYQELKNRNGLTLELKVQDSVYNNSIRQYWYRLCLKLRDIFE